MIVVSAFAVELYFEAVAGSWNRTFTVYEEDALKSVHLFQTEPLPVSKGNPIKRDCQIA